MRLLQALGVALLLTVSLFPSGNSELREEGKSSVSALLVFGDSTVDSGNNNYIKTIAKANFPPYGRDFPGHIPTGRFGNGKLATDFVSEAFGLKETVPPYLDPSLQISDLLTGVCFASSASGLDNFTDVELNVLSPAKQLQLFREYKRRIESAIGKEAASSQIRNALIALSIGTDDFLLNYYLLPVRRQQYNLQQFQNLLASALKAFIQDLIAEGADNIAVIGVPPIGYAPAARTIFKGREVEITKAAEGLNTEVRKFVQNLSKRRTSENQKFLYLDTFGMSFKILRNPTAFGFEVIDRGCCGTGYTELNVLCNPLSPVCPDVSNYVFWDSVHPSEKAYKIIADYYLRTQLSIFLSP